MLSALRAQPGVTSAELNYPLSRVVVSLSDREASVGELCDLVAEAEAPLAAATKPRSIFPATARCSRAGWSRWPLRRSDCAPRWPVALPCGQGSRPGSRLR